jgi:hypothetical protein
MSKKNEKVFVSNNKEITIGDGKIDLSTATAEFKEKVQMFADGINAMNEKAEYYKDCAKTAKHALELYLKGTYTNSAEIEAKEAEIERYKTASAEIRAELKAKMPEFDEVDKNLYYAYKQFAEGQVEYKVYERAFAEWLDNAGIKPTKKGIPFILSQIGFNKASARAMCKNGGTRFVGGKSENPFLDMIYRIVATEMYNKKILRPFVYEYVIADKRTAKKTEEVATPEVAEVKTEEVAA